MAAGRFSASNECTEMLVCFEKSPFPRTGGGLVASAESGRRAGTSRDGRHQHGSWTEEETEEEESPGLLGDAFNGPTDRRSGRNWLFGSGASCFFVLK